MDPFSLLMGIGSIGASIWGTNSAANSVSQTNQQNLALAREQMAFQANMSNTAFQRSVVDMQKAGLNPAVMFTQGGGSSASTPSGAAIPMQNAAGALSAGALELSRTLKELQEIDSRVARNRAETNTAKAMFEGVKLDNEKKDIDLVPLRVKRPFEEGNKVFGLLDALGARLSKWLNFFGK